METKLRFKNTCTACGRSRRKEDLMYDLEKFLPYCSNINICNNKHPNSYTNFASRKNELVHMLPFKEASEVFYEKALDKATPEDVEAFKMTQKPTSIRISEYEHARHILDVKAEFGLTNTSQAIQAIVNEHMIMRKSALTTEVIRAETEKVKADVVEVAKQNASEGEDVF